MNEERLMLKGRRVEYKQDLVRLNEQAQAACMMIRMRVNPLIEPDPEKWDARQVLEAARQLVELTDEMKAIREKLVAVNEALGDE